jgi:hypothetical protein
VSNNCFGTALLGVVGSCRWHGVNVSSRVNRAGYTSTRSVPVSAIPSAGIGSPAPLLGGPGIQGWIVMGLAPAGQIHRSIGVAVGGIPALTSEHPIGQRHIAAD